MSGTDVDKIEEMMKAACVPGPSDAMKARVVEATQKAWRRDRMDVPIRVLVWRLVASTAAAAIFVILADVYSSRTVSPWRPDRVAVAIREPPALESLPELPHAVAAPHLRRRVPRPTAIDASMLRGRLELVLEILNETQAAGGPKPSTSVGGRSRMVPTRPVFDTSC